MSSPGIAVLTLAEHITASFYAWELRGRGWTLADYPVALEPPYRPFFLLPGSGLDGAPIDDGKRPTFWSRLFEGSPRPAPAPEPPFEEEPPFQAATRSELTALRLVLPEDLETDAEVNRRLLLALSSTREPVAWEIIGHRGQAFIQLVACESDSATIAQMLSVYVPEVSLVEQVDSLSIVWEAGGDRLVVDFGLRNEFFLPLVIDGTTAPDRYLPLIAALSRCSEDEAVCLQVLFSRVENPWARTVARAVSDGDGGSIMADAPEYPKLAAEKNASPLLAAVIRVAVAASDRDRVLTLTRKLEAFFGQFARPGGNDLIPLSNDDYPDALHESALLSRTSYRTGMLLSLDELVGLVHLPDASVRHETLARASGKEKRAPEYALGHQLVLGVNTYQGAQALVSVPPTARLEHMHVLGATGSGKSTLLLNLITQDIEHSEGLAVLDPHGDLIDDILERTPRSRIDDIIIFDPSDEDYPVGFNILTANSEIERNLIASDTVAMFRRLSTSWGDAMTTVLGQAVLAMLAHPEAMTLVDLRRFLIDEAFRARFLEAVSDSEIHYFWAKEFPLIGSRSFGPILTRLDTFLRLRLIRNVVGQAKPKLDLARVIAERKVLLLRLSKGLIGEENAALLGSLLVSKFQQCALARQRIPQSSRSPFFLYIDEFHNFVTPSVASLLAEGRKFGMGLVLAHQSLEQLKSVGQVEGAVLGNTHTRIVFRVGDSDAKSLADGFADFDASDLQNLSRGEAIVRMGTARSDFNLTTFPRKPASADVEDLCETINNNSRTNYAREKAEVEAEIAPPKIEKRPAAAKGVATEKVQPAAAPPPQSSIRESIAIEDREARTLLLKSKRPPIGEIKELGKGGQEHRYLQYLIKRLGEERGFRAVIEEQIGDQQSIDVVLRRESVALAFEISVTTEIDHEVENLRKCASLGFAQVFFVSANKRKRDQAIRALKDSGTELVVTPLSPEEIVGALDALELPPTEETVVRGYKVKVSRQVVSYQDLASKRSAVAEVIARSMARGKSAGP